jgi:hypothetical protein
MAGLAVVAVSGCKKTTHITVVQPERTVVREVPVAEPAPVYYEAPAAPAPAPVVVAPAPAPVIVQPAPVVVAPAPVVVEPIVTPAVSVGFFVERLGRHGRWVTVGTYGNVWVPSGVAVGWRPYSAGHWVYTDAYGWTWVSDEPFGWATYHYGRWVFLEPQGWVWVPGTVWAPAWVVWRTGGGYVGWAPMPPEAVVAPVAVSHTEVNINININIEKRIHHNHWVFVEERHVLEPVHAHIVVSKRSDWIINVTRPSTRIVGVNGRIVNRSLAVRDVERASGRKVRTMRIREVDAGETRDARTTVRGDEVVMPRPRLRPITDTRTTGTAGAAGRTTAGQRGAGNAAQPSGATRGGSPRGQDVSAPAKTPAPRTPVTRQPAGTSAKPGTVNNGAVRTREVQPNRAAPSDATRQPAGQTDAPKREPVRQPVTNGQAAPAGSARPAQVRDEKHPRLDPNRVPPERSVRTMGKPAEVKPQAPARPVPAPAAPAPDAVRRVETNRERPAVRQGQDASRKDAGTKRGKAEVQPTPAPAARQPQPTGPGNERIGNVRREAEPAPKEPQANDAGARRVRGNDAQRGGNVSRDRVRADDEKDNDRERKVDRAAAAD